MLALIDQRRNQIAELCRRFQVHRLDLFGSAAGDSFHPERSDVDFLVEFTATEPAGAADRYFGLREGLAGLLGRPVDLVMRNAVRNPYFLKAAEHGAHRLYAA